MPIESGGILLYNLMCTVSFPDYHSVVHVGRGEPGNEAMSPVLQNS